MFIFLIFIILIPNCFGLKALFISVGAAGHAIPLFELAKGMKSHQVTFLTNPMAHAYIDLKSYSSPSFRLLLTNDSVDAVKAGITREHQMLSIASQRSMIDVIPEILPILGEFIIELLNKTIHLLMKEQFDVIVAGRAVAGIPAICAIAQIPCVLQSAAAAPNMFDLNLPNTFSLLSPEDLTQFKYRLYNALFTVRLMTKALPKLIPSGYKIFQSLPRIPGPYSEALTLKNFLFSQIQCLSLVSVPSSFLPHTSSDYRTKYLGTFIDETTSQQQQTDLTQWIESKASKSIVYGAFGSSSLISSDRMSSLLIGLGQFVLQQNDSFLLLALRNANYQTYLSTLNKIDNDYKILFENSSRIRVENGFVPQKWILQQRSIAFFLSHGGMNSILESLYYARPILCMPFSMEQFSNAMSLVDGNLGLSLFEPPSLWESLKDPYNLVHYTFPSSRVTHHLLNLWSNDKYQTAATLMSIEMKHAGGVQRAVKEIEFFVELNGNLDRFVPFQSTLPFYQRWLLDLLFFFIILPSSIIIGFSRRCFTRKTKLKKE